MAQIAEAQTIDVMLSNHPGCDGTVAKLHALKERTAGAPHAFVIGTAAVLRSLPVMSVCVQAQRDRFLMGH